MQKLHLDPHKHTDGVQEFLRFFRLTPGQTGAQLLHEVLIYFARLPYENISKIIKVTESQDGQKPDIRLPEEVIADHIEHSLGGTCFSLTFYLQTILTHLGFPCYPVMADMRVGRNVHCCLLVRMGDAKYLVDPGYLLAQPMELDPGKPRLYKNEFTGVELRFDSGIYDLFTFDRQQTKWRYRFRDQKVEAGEFLQHWFASFGRNSMHGICLSKVLKNGLLYINRGFMRETTFDGKKNFNIKKNFHSVIHENFGIEEQLVEQAMVALQNRSSQRLVQAERGVQPGTD